MESHSIQLKDGRRLGYGEYGTADGVPVMLFHGTPGCRIQPSYDLEAAKRLGIRGIVPERPGFGLSDFQPNRTTIHWSDDVLELANHLGIEKFSVIGISGGGPYAAACAFKIPEHLQWVAIVSSLAPYNAFGEPTDIPTLAEAVDHVNGIAEKFRRDPAEFYEGIVASFPETSPDRQSFKDPAIREWLLVTHKEAFAKGTQGMIHDLMLLHTQPWGFALEDIKANVHIWHGDADESFEQGRYLSEHIPNARFHVLADKGHFVPGLAGDIFKFILAN